MTNYKNLFVVAISLLTASVSQAQSANSDIKKIQAGINIEGAFPMGDFGQSYSFGIGGSVMGRYVLTDKANLTASLGYLSFSGKSITETFDTDDGTQTETYKLPALHGVPLRVGANYVIGGPLFIQGEVGLSFMTGGTAFLYTPG